MLDQQSFWEFSTALYSDPTVKESCLALQDEFDADVNLVLFCLWAGDVDSNILDHAINTAWPVQRDFVKPLRAMRRTLSKAGDEADLRERIAAAELAAEKLEQERLGAILSPGRQQPSAKAARRNLIDYATRLGAEEQAFMAAAAPLLRAIVEN
ncbi:MAG: TIGR02444 family protein [Alphaproteobacteria bacterium]